MAYIGTKPADKPLTAADIADSIITSAKITDATIVNGDIANSTINLTTKVTGTLPVANGGTGLAALGTSLQVLRTNTGATALEYATLSTGAAAGQVIQVVSATDSTTRSTSSTSYVTASNTLSVTITPSSSANKILIIANHYAYGAAAAIHYTIFRGATNLGSASGQNGIGYFDSYGGQFDGSVCYTVLDSPNTTSATTYQVYLKATSGTAYVVSASYLATITALEIKG